MAQLPPKVPNITPTHQPAAPWASEFLGFSAARRGAHRRSVSDSVAFLEECVGRGGEGLGGFDNNDDQLMAMFPDDAAPVVSSPSDRSGVNGMQCEEAEPAAGAPPQEETTAAEKIVDPKRVKR